MQQALCSRRCAAGAVQQAVEQRGGDDRIAEDLSPFGEAAVRGQDYRAFLVAGVDELEEQVRACGGPPAPGDGQVADLVDDQQGCAGMMGNLLCEPPLALGDGETVDDLGEGGAADAPSGLYGGDTESAGQMALAGTGRAEKVDDLAPID